MTDTSVNKGMDNAGDDSDMVDRIEKAYGLYKMSEIFLNDVRDDYGKLKIARLRLDFARHELVSLLFEAQNKGITLNNNELINKFYHPD